MLNELEVTFASAPEEAISVYPLPALLIDVAEKVATPFTGVAERPPARVPALGLLPSDSVTASLASTTVLPPLSTTRTVIAGEIAAPAVLLLGCETNSSAAGDGPAVTSKPRVVAPNRPVLPRSSEYARPALFTA